MADEPLTVLECVIEEQEIREVTYDFPKGPVPGYEWRLRVTDHTKPDRPTVWLPWVFGSRQSVEQMLRQWQNYIQLTTMPPDSPVQ